jgi:hypothetical protein
MNKFALVVMSLVPAAALAQQPAKDAKAPAPQAAQPAKDNAAAKAPMPTPPAPPAAPAEVKATVEAFKGNWKFDVTMIATGMPGMEKPLTAKLTFNCKEVAAKNGVVCEQKGKTAMGPIDATYLIAYDPYSKAVHFMAVTNQNEVHDHVCTWKTATDLACAPLKAGMGPGGDEITEDFSITWSSKKEASFKSVSKMTKGGATVTLDGKGKR